MILLHTIDPFIMYVFHRLKNQNYRYLCSYDHQIIQVDYTRKRCKLCVPKEEDEEEREEEEERY